MERRSFLKTAVAGAVARGRTIPQRVYRDNVRLSTIAFGGIVVMGMDQKDADREVSASIDCGINYFDVAPSYGKGEAEEKLGPALRPHRQNVFLACKTQMRDARGAREDLERSLQRLYTDHFDLYQFHAIGSMDDVEKILAPGGAAETFVKARQEGKVRYLGMSAHSAEAAIALMERMKLDSILFPVNFVLFAQGNFGPQILAKAKEKGMARMALKSLAYTPWKKGEKRTHPKCWYRPITDPELAAKALRFTLSQEITAAVPPGDERCYRIALDIAADFKPMPKAEQEALLALSKGVAPLFKA